MSGSITTLVQDRLYALHNPYELNGFVSTHPTEARGYAPLNCYLLVEGMRALLIDTSFSVHEESLISQISSILPKGATISVFPQIGEFAGSCNTRPVAEHFPIDTVYGIIGTPAAWTDFRPEYSPYGGPVGHGGLARAKPGHVRSTDVVDWAGGARILEAFRPPIRLLPCHWSYDAVTRTLFTGDCFNHVWRDDPGGPWVVDPDEPPPTMAEVYDFLTRSRYWWLPGARTDALVSGLRRVFQDKPIDVIAPRFGCVLADPASIRVHLELFECVLRHSATRQPPSVLTGTSPMGA